MSNHKPMMRRAASDKESLCESSRWRPRSVHVSSCTPNKVPLRRCEGSLPGTNHCISQRWNAYERHAGKLDSVHVSGSEYVDQFVRKGLTAGGLEPRRGGQACYFSAAEPWNSKAKGPIPTIVGGRCKKSPPWASEKA